VANSISTPDLANAITQAILTVSENQEQYRNPAIGERWFNRFIREWGVARTLSGDSGKRTRTVQLLNTELPGIRSSRDPGSLVEETAEKLKNEELSSRRGRPISLVSKVGWFLAPETLIPRDGFRREKDVISKECTRAWVHGLARRLGVSSKELKTAGFARKVFDNILMREGGRGSTRAKKRGLQRGLDSPECL
jgi:hypothetical protein